MPTSVFFQISRTDYIEASELYSGHRVFGVRIVSFQNGLPIFIYLPEMTINELSILSELLRTRLMTDVSSLSQLQRYFATMRFYY